MTNHVHNSVPLQGGPLDFANDTIASLNAGSTTYSDGAALQELVIGNPSDTLVVNGGGTAPEWAASSAGAWVNAGSVLNGASAAELSLAIADFDIIDIIYNCSCDASGGANRFMSMTINGVGAPASYRSTWSYSSGGAWTSNYNLAQPQFRLNGSDLFNYNANNMFGRFTMYKPQTTSMINRVSMRGISGNLSPTGTNYISTMFGDCLETDISSIQLKVENTNIQGSFTVNGMNF